ncbi:10 TM acyl transferase domain found in Cas1p-domain containing protein [Nitzschia inconspicua]|uniref:10 TM acyl transferase domain found in Cas1p-domain containing protein n=1 Tax=Nitzschia inconspicua TaxID=303405 RepID=A0A9K3K7G6_9STRA|nr:10 TM acyl transferase domain found in Cas1p-domain containing protein [Nitzschia inconspicua]KAG7353205.1 10 TM acyl transferase domain found in Cas1p-domain containing protein [Nitzschia inconspicua]
MASHDAALAASMTTMASAMLFGTIIFATAALATRSYIMGDTTLFEAAAHPKSAALDVRSLTSVYTLLFHSSVFGMILFYAYICENHPPFPHADKNYDADIFFFLTFLLLVVSAFTWKRHVPDINSKKALAKGKNHESGNEMEVESGGSFDGNGQQKHPVVTADGTIRPIAEPNDKTEILNRDQTEEWKGWMQFMFLLYHYYHAEEVYNSIRIMITCYVWMTGFGNFSFFYLKADYGVVRVLQMLWRLNFLVLFLCLTQGTTFILYYICLLHTYYFFMVYVIMKIGHQYNYTKWWVRIKLAALAIVIFLVWDCDLGLFKLFHFPFFGETPMMGANAGAMWEWYFRSTLDHWSTYLGMIFALNFPITSLFYRKLEAMSPLKEFLGKGAMGAALFAAFAIWASGPFRQEKFDYNQTNAYYGFIPLITYIYFRNLTPFLRNHTLELLHQIGKTTLETYLMQHHIWLTSNAKSLLTLVPGWPKVNFLLVSLIYVFLSRRLYQLTLFLRGMILPDNRNACFKNLAGMLAVIGSFCGLAYLLEAQKMLSLGAVGMISVAGGYFLYTYLLNCTRWPNESSAEQDIRRNPNKMAFSCLAAVAAVATCGFIWHTMAIRGASRIQLLPSTCQEFANNGNWVARNGCDEGPRGVEYRKFGISAESTCSTQNTVYVWGWDEQDPAFHCRFKQRDPKSLKAHLRGRTIYFAGDSITRYLYHSFCRQLGIADAGAYNAAEGKHHDISRHIDDIDAEFVWAGFATEVVEATKNVTSGVIKTKPDLVVLGGGAWDKLWIYNTQEEKDNMKKALNELTIQMRTLRDKMGIPVVWLTPTTVNSDALPSEEKRENINENEMKKLRDLYKSEGVLASASFVIDGEAFTSTRVAESFDGVHYPHHIYSAGAQILCNSMDWLLPVPNKVPPKPAPQPGAMAHIPLGLMMLCLAAAGLFLFDGFLGFSYIAVIFVPSIAPKHLFYESFSSLHQRMKLPALEMQPLHQSSSCSPPSRTNSMNGGPPAVVKGADEEEVVSLIGKER